MQAMRQVNINYPNPGKGKKKLTTAERWKRKKDSETPKEEDPNSTTITKLTELATCTSFETRSRIGYVCWWFWWKRKSETGWHW